MHDGGGGMHPGRFTVLVARTTYLGVILIRFNIRHKNMDRYVQLGLFTVLVAKSANLRIFWCRGLRAYERDFIGVVGLRLYEIDFMT